jgi:U3 small nucleolar RNA-associated protein 19
MMNLVRSESTFLTSLHRSRQAQFPSSTFSHVVRAILVPSAQQQFDLDNASIRSEIKDEWLKWWNRDDDVRFYFLKQSA